VNCSRAEVQAWESGDAEPTEEQLADLARLFGLSVARLHGAPLAMDRDLSYVCGGRDLTHEDQYEVARFFEYLHYANQGVTR
jgi:hypothetical protein